MADMSRKQAQKTGLTEEEIDEIVVSQANDDSAWEEPIYVKRQAAPAFSLPADLVGRAAFLARLHHARALEDWLTRVIRERIELEEFAFAEAKRELARIGRE